MSLSPRPPRAHRFVHNGWEYVSPNPGPETPPEPLEWPQELFDDEVWEDPKVEVKRKKDLETIAIFGFQTALVFLNPWFWLFVFLFVIVGCSLL